MFAHVTEAAKKANKKISSCTVDTDVVVLVIPVGWMNCGVCKNRWLSLV